MDILAISHMLVREREEVWRVIVMGQWRVTEVYNLHHIDDHIDDHTNNH
jgi:hypothetical protein